jgi:methionyl-tRNA formyltransferase
MEGKMTHPELVGKVRSWRPDFILVAGWYHMVPASVRQMAPTAGLHASLLPDYSGGAPLVWAIINGERQTGITLFLMDDGVDTGPIIGQAAEPIHPDDTIATLYARIEQRGVELLREHLPRIARGEATFTAQDESRRRVTPQRSPADGEIDWAAPARRVYDFVRAQTRPYPGAFTHLAGEQVVVWRARLSEMRRRHESPGTVEPRPPDGADAFGVWCGDGRLLLVQEIGLADGQSASGRAFAEARRIGPGTPLGRTARQPGRNTK